MSRSAALIPMVALLASCPNKGNHESDGMMSTWGSSTAQTSSSTETGPGTTTSGSGNTTETASSGTTAGAGCGDGIAQPQEWCHQEHAFDTIDADRIGTGDLNGDGVNEVLVWASTELWAVGPDLQLQMLAPVPIAWGPYSQVQVGDFEGDGWNDVFLNNDDTLIVYHNQAGILDSKAEGIPVLDYAPRHLAVVDVDGDGKSEYFGLSMTDAFLHRQINGALELAQTFPQLIPCDYVETMRVADLNADNFGDVVVLTLGCEEQPDDVPVLVLLGTGSPTLTVAGQYPTGAGPAGLEIGDVDGDGKQDVVTVNLGTKDVSVLLNLGDGSFADQLRFAVDPRITSFAVGAFDGAAGDELLLLKGDATWIFAPLGIWNEPRAVMGTSFRTLDMNSDGVSDVAFGLLDDAPGRPLRILLSNP